MGRRRKTIRSIISQYMTVEPINIILNHFYFLKTFLSKLSLKFYFLSIIKDSKYHPKLFVVLTFIKHSVHILLYAFPCTK